MKNYKKPSALFGGVALIFLGQGLLAACAADDEGLSPASAGDGNATGDGDAPSVATGGSINGSDIGFGGSGNPVLPPLPEEVEEETSYRAPVATGRYLWSANPESGRVALIDVVEITTRVLPAGLFPTYLTSIGDGDNQAAIVLNTGSSDATRFRVTDSEVLRDSVAVHVGANRWSTSVSGDWAIAWSGQERGEELDPTEGLQEITVIALGDKKMTPTRLTVGYRPSQIHVSEDETRLIVVSEEGITIIDLVDGPEQVEWFDLGFDAENRDVSVSSDGNYALVRRTGEAKVEVLDLVSPKKSVEVTLSGPVTDLDMSRADRAVAVIRSKSELSTFTIEDVLADPSDVDTVKVAGEVFGSAALTDDGRTAVLYTNALVNERISIVDLRGTSFLETRSLNTQAPVFSVVTAPDGKHAVVLAAEGDQAAGDQGRPAEAFSVIALRSERFPRVVGTGAPVRDVALSNAFGIVTATSQVSDVHEAYLIELPGLSVQKERLATRPLSAGVLTDLRVAYAAQTHPEGRVTFFDFEADQTRTLTGFELSAEVVDE